MYAVYILFCRMNFLSDIRPNFDLAFRRSRRISRNRASARQLFDLNTFGRFDTATPPVAGLPQNGRRSSLHLTLVLMQVMLRDVLLIKSS